MKKLFSILLCLLLIIGAVSCSKPSNTGNPNSETLQDNIDSSDENATSQGNDPYKDVIEKYKELLLCKKNNATFPETSETDSAALRTLYELAKKCRTPLDMGYAKKDINGDGIEELIFMESTFDIVAIFTIKNGDAVTLITQEDVNCLIWLDESGLVRMEQLVMEGQYMAGRKYFTYEISEGALKPQVAIGCDAMKQGNWHKLEGKQQIPVSKEDWNELYAQYDICPFGWDEREYTKNYANLTVLPLLEAATPKIQTYKLTSIIKDDRVKITSVSDKSVSFEMIYNKYSESVLIYETELSVTANLDDGKYMFDNGTVKGSIEFGHNSVWVNINESTNEHIDCRSYLFDYPEN